ncbi:MAG: hypothetical protein IJ482_05445 [Alphaproteobacteria bacterium]|nr:hypothetical protein [Alphaproteobacteria bacterium]
MLTTSERVALYKKELAENGKQPVFDVYAFVFNSFYYLYYDSFRWFLLFALLPLIGMFIPGNPAFNFLSGMLAARVVNGFAAPHIMRRVKKKYVENFAEADSEARIEYFSVSSLRLAVLSVLSLGLYFFYWSYKNWAAVKKYTKDDVWPILWSWFLWLFFIIPLFVRMKNSLRQNGCRTGKLMICGGVFIALYVTYRLGDVWIEQLAQVMSPAAVVFAVYFLFACFLLAAVMLALVQKEINVYNGIKVRKNILSGEVIVTLLGLYLFLRMIGVLPPVGV